MTYDTFSSDAPSNQTGIDQSLVLDVRQNPFHPNTSQNSYPQTYPQFISKTNNAGARVAVDDETHAASEILTGAYNNALYMNHIPVFQTEITVSDGVLDTALTDYQHGIVYFSTMPTGDSVQVQYIAEPDKYYAEHMQAIQDVIHKMILELGAGSNLNEGIRNAEFFLDSLPAGIQQRLPQAIHIREIDRDILIASTTDSGSPNGTRHTITFGNGEDDVVVNAQRFVVKRSTTDSYVTTRLGDETGDLLQVAGDSQFTGDMTVGNPTSSRNPSITDADITAFETTGVPFTGDTWIFKAHGDAVIYGDMYVLGDIVTVNIERNIQVNVFEENLEVGNDMYVAGDTRLGASTSQSVYVGGTMAVTGGLDVIGAGGAISRFDTPIFFTDGSLKGPFQQITIDGLDPSYVERIRRWLNIDRAGQMAYEGIRNFEFQGTVDTAGTTEEVIDSAATALTGLYPDGTYYPQKYDDGTFILTIEDGDHEGSHIPVRSFNPETNTWRLARALSSAAATGVNFTVASPGYNRPNCVQAGAGLSVDVVASEIYRLVGMADGKIKVRTSNYNVSSLPASSTVYIFMSAQNNVNGIDEDEPTFFYRTHDYEDERSVLLAKVTTDGSAVTSVTNYVVNRFDTQWVKFDSASTGNVQQAGSDWTINAALGNVKRQLYEAPSLAVWVAADTGNAPDIGGQLMVHMDSAGYYIKSMTDSTITLGTPGGTFLGVSLPYWVRVLVRKQ